MSLTLCRNGSTQKGKESTIRKERTQEGQIREIRGKPATTAGTTQQDRLCGEPAGASERNDVIYAFPTVCPYSFSFVRCVREVCAFACTYVACIVFACIGLRALITCDGVIY